MDIYLVAQSFGKVLNIFGICVIVVGIFVVSSYYAGEFITNRKESILIYKKYRQNLGRVILLGLEILVAGDIIRTVVGEPNLTSIAVLGIIVLIRTFLSLAFEMEIEGKLPWK